MVRRTKEEAQATRHRILDAAELLFQQHGVSRTTLQDIAQAAELTRGAVYWHFKDKADLFNAMMERATMPLEETMALSPSPGEDDDPLSFIRDRIMHALRITASHEPTRRVFEIATHKVEYVDELLAVRDRHLLGRNECLAEVERELKSAMRRGLVRSDVPARSRNVRSPARSTASARRAAPWPSPESCCSSTLTTIRSGLAERN